MNRYISISGIALLTLTSVICQSAIDVPDEPPPVNIPTDSEPSTANGLKLISNPLAAAHVEKRLFGVLPNYRAEQDSAEYKPLKAWEKFKIAERDTFDWPNFPMMIGFALQTQVAEKGWHEKGFGRNFGEYYARSFSDALIGNYITEALMPTLLHEDPRFFRSGVGPVWKRAYKAARQVVVTRNESGQMQFNFSEVLGNSAVVAVTSLYYPDSRRLGPGATRVALAIGNDVISNLLTEFWPDVKRQLQPRFPAILHHHQPASY